MPLFMALFGGMARTARHGWKCWSKFVSDLFVAGFTGIMVYLMLADAPMTPEMKAALSGTSGYAGVLVLDGLVAIVIRILERITGQSFQSTWDGVERRKGVRGEQKGGGEAG